MQLLDDDPTIPVVHLESTPKPRDKSLRTNHSCALCGVYGHYSHHCPDLPEYRVALFEMNNLDLETAPPTIVEIQPPDSSSPEEVDTIYMISMSDHVFAPPFTFEPFDLTTRVFYTYEEIL